MVGKRFVLLLVGLGLAAGVYVGVTMVRRPRPVALATTGEPATPSPQSTGEARATNAPPPTATEPATARRPPAPRVPAPRADTPRPTPAPVTDEPTVGILDIDTDVSGAQVFIDREFIGAAPIRGHEVKPGSYRLNVSAPGFDGLADTIEIAPGARHLTFNLREVRLEAGIEVVHKHRMGSCKGRLTATPQGLRYETANKDDLFSSALVDLETFEVDYLEKNLRVKPRKGRTYDFTDPAGNADHLFVFHRDVDKARERLRKGDPAAPARSEGSAPR